MIIQMWIDTDADTSQVLDQAIVAQKNIAEELETYGYEVKFDENNVTVDNE